MRAPETFVDNKRTNRFSKRTKKVRNQLQDLCARRFALRGKRHIYVFFCFN